MTWSALPTKPLYVIQLRDADTMSSLLFVNRKLQSIGMNLEFTREQAAHVERLGGRASDLELVSMTEPGRERTQAKFVSS